MRTLSTIAVFGLALLAAPAIAQGGPPPGFVPPPPVAAPLWPMDVPFVNTRPVLFADLGQGSPDSFTAVLDPATNQLCYMLSAPGREAPTMAHIHKGGPGESGAPVVALANPAGGSSGGCVAVKPEVAQALLANPGGYYVNVHTAAIPDGFERGQLQTKGKAQAM
ncbi:MAG: CHRD domain-containing protein [Candidatus Andeanibacterium colombiense]|uniref:CHRD domain-containing protein n=1 Tax=Candidatus Andeanibacterium colombiense TaxID=3121345 RepID=A0AAJ5X7P5_9SPHN|nr:MAG: CHRD domain-containing protein [Sphingomonadaceae bacterium]